LIHILFYKFIKRSTLAGCKKEESFFIGEKKDLLLKNMIMVVLLALFTLK
jgi:hypothetical protein